MTHPAVRDANNELRATEVTITILAKLVVSAGEDFLAHKV
jgi:hypothetical protein